MVWIKITIVKCKFRKNLIAAHWIKTFEKQYWKQKIDLKNYSWETVVHLEPVILLKHYNDGF